MIDGRTSIRRVAERVFRHPLLREIDFETVVDYVADFLEIVGCPRLMSEKTEVLDINEHRIVLPCDYISIIQLREVPDGKHQKVRCYRYATDSFHLSPNEYGPNDRELTYKIQGGVIYTSTSNGQAELAYNAIDTDDEGLPVIPDSPLFLRAAEAYIKVMWFTVLMDTGQMQPAVLQNAQQEYAWAVGALEAEAQRMSLDKSESLMNMWNTLIMHKKEHASGFRTLGSEEHLRIG